MSSRPLRIGIADAKARFAEIVADAPRRRAIIQRRGKDVAVVIGIDELARLERAQSGDTAGARLLARLERIKRRRAPVEGIEPVPVVLDPVSPFARPKRRSAEKLTVATRNVADSRGHGVLVRDPFVPA